MLLICIFGEQIASNQKFSLYGQTVTKIFTETFLTNLKFRSLLSKTRIELNWTKLIWIDLNWTELSYCAHRFLASIICQQGSESPEKHFIYVWDKIIMPTAAKHIAIMAHSYGGMVVVDGVCILSYLFNGVCIFALITSIRALGNLLEHWYPAKNDPINRTLSPFWKYSSKFDVVTDITEFWNGSLLLCIFVFTR